MLALEEKKMAKDIMELVAQHYGITTSVILTGKRWFPDVEARYACFFLLKKYAFRDDPPVEANRKIAHIFNLKNGNIIRYALRRINFAWLKFDAQFREAFETMDQNINKP